MVKSNIELTYISMCVKSTVNRMFFNEDAGIKISKAPGLLIRSERVKQKLHFDKTFKRQSYAATLYV